MTARPSRAPVDWEAIEREYRAGQLSVREVARQFDLTEGAIRKRAKAEAWSRPLAEKVREAVRERLVRNDGTQGGTQSRASDAEVIEMAADRVIQVVREHRVLIGRGKALVATLLGELEEATEHRAEIEQAVWDETAEDKTGQRRARMLAAVALPVRATTLLSLANASKTFVGLDRQAFGLAEDSGDGRPPDAPQIIEMVLVDP